jgi:hypothetical protein
MGSGADAARAFGGIFAVVWIFALVLVTVAMIRLRRLGRTIPIIYAYTPAKAAVLGTLALWCGTKIFIAWWWIMPRALPWRSITTEVMVEGVCRPLVFFSVLMYWRSPLSSFMLDSRVLQRTAGPELPAVPHSHRNIGDAQEMVQRRAHDNGGEDVFSEVETPSEAGGYSTGAALQRKHSMRSDTHARTTSLETSGGERNEHERTHTRLVDEKLETRLRAAVVSRSRIIPPIVLAMICVVAHVSLGIAQARVTENSGGITWCIDRPRGIEMCVVPLEGRSRESILRRIHEAIGTPTPTVPNCTDTANSTAEVCRNVTVETNVTWVGSTGAPVTSVPGIEELIVVDEGFDAVDVLVVPAQVTIVIAFVLKAILAVFWVISSHHHQHALINHVAMERFQMFRYVTICACVVTATAHFTMLFDAVRSMGAAFTTALLITDGADVTIVVMVALRAAKFKHFSSAPYSPSRGTSVGEAQLGGETAANTEPAERSGILGRFAGLQRREVHSRRDSEDSMPRIVSRISSDSFAV